MEWANGGDKLSKIKGHVGITLMEYDTFKVLVAAQPFAAVDDQTNRGKRAAKLTASLPMR